MRSIKACRSCMAMRGNQCKFHLEGGMQYEMAFGSLDLFYGGLEGLIGPPQMVNGSIHKAMEADHCAHKDAKITFTSSNGVSTTSETEWEIVFNPAMDRSYPERKHFRTDTGNELQPEKKARSGYDFEGEDGGAECTARAAGHGDGFG